MDKRTLETVIKKSRQKKRGAKTEVFLEIDGETRSLKEWAKFFDIPYYTILYRYHAGYTDRDLIKPPRKNPNNFLK